MPGRRTEGTFNKGMQAVDRGDFLEALACFEACMELDHRTSGPIQVRAMSYYGLCLAMVSDRLQEAREICEAALPASPHDPDLHANLARVCVRQGDRGQAFRTLVRGLGQNPRHPGLVEALRELGFRQRPVIAFLPRTHPVNQMLGSLRATLERNVRKAGRPASNRRPKAA
jgi:tetratricopeptide (TPR) repeat protein